MKRDDVYEWEGHCIRVERVSKKGEWADIFVYQLSTRASWTKRQPLPFPASWTKVTA